MTVEQSFVDADRRFVAELCVKPPADWTPTTIMAAQSFLRRAYLEKGKSDDN